MQVDGRRNQTIQVPRDLKIQMVTCREKGGQWDRNVNLCVLPDNKIFSRGEAIENAVYRICDAKYNYEEYDDLIGCFHWEGFDRIKKMKNHPHQPLFLEPKIMKTFMSETYLGDPEKSNVQYRFPGSTGWIHGRDYDDYGLIHADKHKPTDIIQHLGEYLEYKILEKK